MAQIKADEITQLLREQIANYDSKVQVDEVGTITSLGDGIARLHGLDKVMAGELLSFPARHRRTGPEPRRRLRWAPSFWATTPSSSEGDEVKRTGKILSVPVGDGHDWPRGQRARRAHRRQGADRHHGDRCPWSASLPASSTARECASPWPPDSRPSTP